MKLIFDVEKTYKDKKYYPNIVYEFSEEEAKDILSKTKYAHVSKKDACTEVSVKLRSKKKKAVVETVENEVENS